MFTLYRNERFCAALAQRIPSETSVTEVDHRPHELNYTRARVDHVASGDGFGICYMLNVCVLSRYLRHNSRDHDYSSLAFSVLEIKK